MVVYRLYAYRMQQGLWPYHDFFFDWAPGSVPPVYMPTWMPAPYYVGFHELAFLYAALGVLALAYTLVLLGASDRRLYLATAATCAMPFALGAIAVNSLDYWPALFTGAGIAALVGGRNRLAFALLGFAVAAKVYALVLLPIVLLWVWRRHGRRETERSVAVGVGVVVVVSLPFLAVGAHGLGYSVYTQFRRGLQMESLGASILMALDHLGAYQAHVVVGQPYSLDVAGGIAKGVAALFTAVTVAALVWIYVRYWRGPDERQRLVTACVAAVAAYVAFGRVLSPQYLVWLFALVPLLDGLAGVAATLGLLLACALTQTWFPSRFFHLVHVSPVSWFVLLRNVVLVAVTAAAASPLLRRHDVEARAAEPRGGHEIPQH
jgi:hypothetical protein